jgi:hypothetical protein
MTAAMRTKPAPPASQRGSRARAQTMATATRIPRQSSTPSTPSAQGRDAPGSATVVWAICAIQADGAQANRTNDSPSAGAHVMVRQARQPRTVAIGAAGAARRFAATPYSGSVGVSSTRMGWHANCAASGTATARATARGIHRARTRASGPASMRRPAVAATERAKPKSRAIHGSCTRRTITARLNAGSPSAGRPLANAKRTTSAIVAARRMLAAGPTRTTKARSAVAAATTRSHRPAPTREARRNTNPVTSAQFAPDTAVKWLSELAFISSSSLADTADSSPMARPGSSAPPSPGVPAAASANASRTGTVHATQGGAGETGPGISAAVRRKLVPSPGSFCCRVPRTSTDEPSGGAPG